MSFHDQAIELLKLISSFDEQIQYEKSVPIADVPAELICMWFNDVYHLTEDFKNDFTADELAALSKFNSFYDEKIPFLLDLKSELKEFHNSPVWKEVSEEAKKALNKLKTV